MPSKFQRQAVIRKVEWTKTGGISHKNKDYSKVNVNNDGKSDIFNAERMLYIINDA
jgi:hypothetical protein